MPPRPAVDAPQTVAPQVEEERLQDQERRSEELRDRYANLPLDSKMSNWYDIFSLFGTVRDALVSDVFRERIDYRMLVAFREHSTAEDSAAATLAPESTRGFVAHPTYFEYQIEPGQDALWFDYASDVGDGFNSTYHIACQLGADELQVSGVAQKLPRGRFLLLGGDEVYPSASRELYEHRFVRPYEAACYQPQAPDRDRAPHLYAIPGNHDWYDGLASFMNVFGEKRAIGSWRTQQRKSYFAIKLPQNLWIFATDIGLGGELDENQVLYFQGLVRTQMEADGRIILCLAEPDWVKPRPNVQNLRDGLFYLERKLVDANGPDGPPAKVRVILRLAGDLHHYRRHQSVEAPPPSDFALQREQGGELPAPGPMRIVENLTAGGGGAFLHPTHELPPLDPPARAEGGAEAGEGDIVRHPPGRQPLTFRCKSAFPDFATSRRLTRRNILFFLHNPRMWLVLWLFYGPMLHLGFWLLEKCSPLWLLPNPELTRPIMASGCGLGLLVGGIAFGLISGCAAFAATNATGESGEAKRGRGRRVYFSHSRRTKAQRIGAVHGIAQLLLFGLVLLGGGMLHLALEGYLQHTAYHDIAEVLSPVTLFLCAVLAAFLGALLSMFCFGTYLFLALNYGSLRLHANDAFASLRSEKYKNFLRIKLTADELTIYPIGFTGVPTEWKFLNLDGKAAPGQAAPTLHQPLFQPAAEDATTRPMLIEAAPVRIRLRDEEQGP